MEECEKLTKDEIAQIYSKIEEYHHRYLENYGVKMPKLFNSDKSYTKDALVLIYLTRDYPNTKMTSKTELTQFVRLFYSSVNDVQQARHLGAQKGWYILYRVVEITSF